MALAASSAGSAIPCRPPTENSAANGTDSRCAESSDDETSTPSAVGNIEQSSSPPMAGFTEYAPSCPAATMFRPDTSGSAATALDPMRQRRIVPVPTPSRSRRNAQGPRAHGTPAVRWKSVPVFGPDDTGMSFLAEASVHPSSSRTSAPSTFAPGGTVSTSSGLSPDRIIRGLSTPARSTSSATFPSAENIFSFSCMSRLQSLRFSRCCRFPRPVSLSRGCPPHGARRAVRR